MEMFVLNVDSTINSFIQVKDTGEPSELPIHGISQPLYYMLLPGTY